MGSRVLSLWLPYLATDLIRRDRHRQEKIDGPQATFASCATSASGEKSSRLIALCPMAERAGLKPGMTLDEARAKAPSLKLLPSDPKGEEALLETIKTWCERYTPWAAIDRSHGQQKGKALWLDIKSSTHLFGGEASLMTDLIERLRDQSLHAKAAIADHPGTAWAMARFGAKSKKILPVNGARLALASLPIDALRLDDEALTRLNDLGIEHIEPLYALPRQVLRARFGQNLVKRLDQALGMLDEPIAPNAPLPGQQAQLIFADPIMSSEALLPSVKRLVKQLAVGLEAAGLGVCRLTLALYRVDGSTASLSIGSLHPTRNIKALSRQLADEAVDIDLGFGIERMILNAVEIEPLLPETIAWRGLGTGDASPFRDLAHNRIQRNDQDNRQGVTAAMSRPQRTRHQPPSFGNLATALALSPVANEQPETRRADAKPLRLLRQPEPIEAIAPLPDEPPILFRWRQGLYRIVRAQGPERVAPGWWRIPESEQPSIGHEMTSKLQEERRLRDYFAVEDSDGDRFWLFREGLYQTSQAILPRWYLHGLFR